MEVLQLSEQIQNYLASLLPFIDNKDDIIVSNINLHNITYTHTCTLKLEYKKIYDKHYLEAKDGEVTYKQKDKFSQILEDHDNKDYIELVNELFDNLKNNEIELRNIFADKDELSLTLNKTPIFALITNSEVNDSLESFHVQYATVINKCYSDSIDDENFNHLLLYFNDHSPNLSNVKLNLSLENNNIVISYDHKYQIIQADIEYCEDNKLTEDFILDESNNSFIAINEDLLIKRFSDNFYTSFANEYSSELTNLIENNLQNFSKEDKLIENISEFLDSKSNIIYKLNLLLKNEQYTLPDNIVTEVANYIIPIIYKSKQTKDLFLNLLLNTKESLQLELIEQAKASYTQHILDLLQNLLDNDEPHIAVKATSEYEKYRQNITEIDKNHTQETNEQVLILLCSILVKYIDYKNPLHALLYDYLFKLAPANQEPIIKIIIDTLNQNCYKIITELTCDLDVTQPQTNKLPLYYETLHKLVAIDKLLNKQLEVYGNFIKAHSKITNIEHIVKKSDEIVSIIELWQNALNFLQQQQFDELNQKALAIKTQDDYIKVDNDFNQLVNELAAKGIQKHFNNQIFNIKNTLANKQDCFIGLMHKQSFIIAAIVALICIIICLFSFKNLTAYLIATIVISGIVNLVAFIHSKKQTTKYFTLIKNTDFILVKGNNNELLLACCLFFSLLSISFVLKLFF